MNTSLFDIKSPASPSKDSLGAGTAILVGFALNVENELLAALQCVVAQSPFRQMITPGGFRMSVAMSNCGKFGWVTDRTGYRYDSIDPATNRPWPHMPSPFVSLAASAAKEAGFPNFSSDACLINRYEPGRDCHCIRTKMSATFPNPLSRSHWD